MSTHSEILAMLDASPVLVLAPFGKPGGINAIYDGYVKPDETTKVISVPLPYIAVYSSTGRDNDVRQSGQVAGRVKRFRIEGVGSTTDQVIQVLDEARKMLSRKRLNGNLIIRDDDDLEARREDTYTRPGNLPLFYGTDRYSVPI